MKKIIAISTPQKLEKVSITSAQKEKALTRLKTFEDHYFLETFRDLLENQFTPYTGFPSPLNQLLTALHLMKWMNPSLSNTELGLIDGAIEIQLTKTIIPMLIFLFQTPDSWSLEAVQLLCPRIEPVAFKLEEHPYVRLYFKNCKIRWRIQQYDNLLFPGSSHKNVPAYIEKSDWTIDLSIPEFLTFKQAGKRTFSDKKITIKNVDTEQKIRYSRKRPDRAVREENKGIKNSTRLFDVDEYGELNAHRPDGLLYGYDFEACFTKAKNPNSEFSNKHDDAVKSLKNYIQLLFEQYQIIDSKKKVVFQFQSSNDLSQWLFPILKQTKQWIKNVDVKNTNCPNWILKTSLWGPKKIVALNEVFSDIIQNTSNFLVYDTLINELFHTLTQVKQNHDTGNGNCIRYDHIPQKAAIQHYERSKRKYRKDADIVDTSFAIALPKWVDSNGETNTKKPDDNLTLPAQLLRDIQTEWQFWSQPGHYQEQKNSLQKTNFEALGAYRYLAKRFIKRYSESNSILQITSGELDSIDDFFTKTLQKLSLQGK